MNIDDLLYYGDGDLYFVYPVTYSEGILVDLSADI